MDSEKREMVSYKLPVSLIKKLNDYSEKTKYKKTAIIELALEDYFKKHN